MININENNKIFAELVMEIIKDKYDILFNYYMLKTDGDWSTLLIRFSINYKENYMTFPIFYQVQVIDKLVEDITKSIDEQIIKSHMK